MHLRSIFEDFQFFGPKSGLIASTPLGTDIIDYIFTNTSTNIMYVRRSTLFTLNVTNIENLFTG